MSRLNLMQVAWLSNKRITWISLLCVAFALFLSRIYLFIIRPIPFFDESLYLAYVRGVVKHGAIPAWSANPGVALLNAIWFAPLYDLPMGLDYASRIGMFIAESVLFIVLAWVAYELFRGRRWQFLALLLTLVAAPFWSISQNSSDIYYALFVTLCLGVLVMALSYPPTHPIWVSVAIVMGITASIRNDGIVLFAATTVVYAIYLWRTPMIWRQRIITGIKWWLLPLGGILLLYWLLIFRAGGIYFPYSDTVGMAFDEVALSGRTYLAFEQGEGYVRRFELEKIGKSWWQEGSAIAAETYGTEESNQGNVIFALANNPGAWLNRLKWNLRDFFLAWHEAFTLHALPLFILSVWGWGLAWRHHWRFAVATLVILVPTLPYFLVTFWIYRYIAFLAPLWVLLGTYAIFAFATLPRRPDFKWNLGLAIIAAILGLLFIEAVEGRSVPIPFPTLLISVCLYGFFGWRFLLPSMVASRIIPIGTLLIAIALVIGTFSPLPTARSASSPYQVESRAYLLNVYEYYRDIPVCINYGDLDALSLAWHARQIPVLITNTTMAEAAEQGLLTEIFKQHGCRFGLQTGGSEQHLRIIGSTPNRVNLFLQGWSNIYFFEITNNAE
jgi:hypothetical protein